MSTVFPMINSSIPPSTMSPAVLTTPMINGTLQLFFQPESINSLVRGCNTTVYFNSTFVSGDNGSDWDLNATYFAQVLSQNDKIAQFVIPADMVVPDPYDPDKTGPFYTGDLVFPVHLNAINNFTIQAMHIGYVTILVTVFGTTSMAMAKNHLSQTIGRSEYKVTVTPRQKTADFVFDCSAAAVAILISFGIGCVTDTESLKRQLKYPVSLVIGFCCQFLLMPVVSIYFQCHKGRTTEPDYNFHYQAMEISVRHTQSNENFHCQGME